MRKGADLFIGTHDFSSFIAQVSGTSRTRRTVAVCKLMENTELTASFFPEVSYYLEVGGEGFGRYQVRSMMTGLVALGRGEVSETEIRRTLETGVPLPIREISPASGLQLVDVRFDDSVL